jgi:hypothetical protein
MVRVSSNLCYPAISNSGQDPAAYLADTACGFYGITHEHVSFNDVSLQQNIVSQRCHDVERFYVPWSTLSDIGR